MRVCKYLNQRVRRIGEKNGKLLNGASKTKQNKKKKTHEEIDFHNSIQALTSVYRMQKSAWKSAWPVSWTQPQFEAPGNLHIKEVMVTCPKLVLGQLIQIQVMDSVSDKILKIYIYIKSSSL